MRARLQGGIFFTGTLTDFLGTMLPGETKAAFFIIDVDSNTQVGEYNFDLGIDWGQDDYALDDMLILSFDIKPSSFPVTTLAFGVVLLFSLVAAYLIFKRIRRR